MLHILNKTQQHPAFTLCCNAIEPGDSVILIEDGAYCASSNQAVQQLSPATLYVLNDSLAQRGIGTDSAVTGIDYEKFVALTVDHEQSTSWY